MSESRPLVICWNSRRLMDWLQGKPTHSAAAVVAGGYAKMRSGLVLLILLLSAGCARFDKPAAQAQAPHAAAPEQPAPVAAARPAGFNCSDGTVSTSLDACLTDMARARLPPQQPPATGNAPAAVGR
jgi:hypothetical protein